MRTETKKAIPRPPVGRAESAAGRTGAGDEVSFDWAALVLQAVHPVKVAIVEALLRQRVPLSASRLSADLEGSGYSLGVISHHLKGLADWGAVELVEERQVRGTTEKLYYFPSRLPLQEISRMAEEPKSEPQPGLGKAVHHLRQEMGLTREALAEKSGLPVTSLEQIEGGQDDPPWGSMRHVAEGLGVTLESMADMAERFEQIAGDQ